MTNVLGVAIVGVEAGRSWGATGHVPALRTMPDQFDILGVANTSHESALRAAEACAIPRAYRGVDELLADDAVDIVAITVKVPYHLELVQAAFAAGKHVYCEWPLGLDAAEAEEMARAARTHRRLGVVGLQARVSPEVMYAAELIRDRYVGEVLSATIVGRGRGWAGSIRTRAVAYVLDRTLGSTMLTVPVGHTLSAVGAVLGEINEVSALLARRRKTAVVADTGETLPMTAWDQVIVGGVLAGGAPLSLHMRGGEARDGAGFVWEINGTQGDLRLTASSGHAQQVQFAIEGGQGPGAAMEPIPVPPHLRRGAPDNPVLGNVVRAYQRMAVDLREGTRTAPDFEDAVAVHRIIDSIEQSNAAGRRLELSRGPAPKTGTHA